MSYVLLVLCCKRLVFLLCDDLRILRRITGKSSLADWADETVSNTHIGKWKLKTITNKGKGKKTKESAWKR
jgi:hypothetical protein